VIIWAVAGGHIFYSLAEDDLFLISLYNGWKISWSASPILARKSEPLLFSSDPFSLTMECVGGWEDVENLIYCGSRPLFVVNLSEKTYFWYIG
jgi:hypothetical protein